jgi:hypothetical protein
MNNLVSNAIALLFFVLITCSCVDNINPDTCKTDGINIQIGSSVSLTKNEIDYYDHSAHYAYLKDGVRLDAKSLKNSKFWVMCGEESIYEGIAFCSYADSIGINDLEIRYENNPEQFVRISNIMTFQQIYEQEYDPRNDERIIQVLKDEGLYHPGLTCAIDTIIRESAGKVVLKLRLSNTDSFNYYFLDPDKMDFQQYHYFTNGLSLYQWEPFSSYHNNVKAIVPEMYCCYGEDWVSLLKSGETKIITITYDQFDDFPPGTYCAVFSFHGEMLKLPDENSNLLDLGKVWLGDIQLAQRITIE